MKILTLLRHAKSGWDNPGLRDFDRPLNRRGRKAAQAIGRAMRAEGMAFDAVLASPAVRVSETLKDLREAYSRDLDITEDQSLYLASPAVLLERIHEVDDGVERLLLVGHNPGLEQLTLLLAGCAEEGLLDCVADKYPTAAVAVIRFDVASWADVAEGQGKLTRFLRPRDLDPELGPDD
jgi:phosphohistidine phosphatase